MAKDVVDIKLGQLELRVEGVYIPFRHGKMYMSNGDPGYPDEPAEFEITKVFFKDTDVSDLLNEIDTYYYNKVDDKVKHIGIWEMLDEITIKTYENLIE